MHVFASIVTLVNKPPVKLVKSECHWTVFIAFWVVIELYDSEATWICGVNTLCVVELFAIVTQCNQVEERVEVFKTNPECAVIFIGQVDLLASAWGPLC